MKTNSKKILLFNGILVILTILIDMWIIISAKNPTTTISYGRFPVIIVTAIWLIANIVAIPLLLKESFKRKAQRLPWKFYLLMACLALLFYIAQSYLYSMLAILVASLALAIFGISLLINYLIFYKNKQNNKMLTLIILFLFISLLIFGILFLLAQQGFSS